MNRSRTASVAFILITLLLDTLGIGLIIPVLPRLVTTMARNDLAAASHYYGVFVAVYATMQFIFAPIIGGLSDRFGRRSVLLVSVLGAAADHILLVFAPNLSWLFVGRVIAGITGASFSTATAYIADVTPAEKRAQSFGLVGAAFGLGFIIGPALGGLLGGVHLRLPFAVASALNLLNFFYGLFVLPESLPPEKRRPFSFARSNPFGSLANLGKHAVLVGLTGTIVCALMAQQILQGVWALYGQGRFGWNEMNVGLSLTVVGVMSAIVQGGIIRVLIPRIGERRAMLTGYSISVAGFVAFGLANRGWMMYAIMVPFALGGIAGPAVQSLISRQVASSEQGQLQGSLSSLQSLTAIVGPLIGTTLFAWFGPATARFHVPGAPYFAAAVFHVLAIVLALRMFARSPELGGPHSSVRSPVSPPTMDTATAGQ